MKSKRGNEPTVMDRIDAKGVIRYKWAGAPGAKAIDAGLATLIQEVEKDVPKPPK